MELPIDHFRLLGVNPSVDSEVVLRTLQVRLDRSPDQGFTHEALTQRSELLRLTADLLSDSPLRQEYEEALLGGAEGLEISSSREVGGLILLWEADSSMEAFQLSCKALQPPQAPALGSGRESDLTLLASLSCISAAQQEQEDRHYEAAAIVLQQGIQLLQRMGKLPDQRNQLEAELEALLPFRILDLLSRDLGDQSSHKDGIQLLNNFVFRRGGLEGRTPEKAKTVLDQAEFERFFQQIRHFLTVQEQVDLFLGWKSAGSLDAGFLGALALVAAGFSRRKPDRLQQARRLLEKINLPELDLLPLLGCIDLLLADVELAQERFLNSSDNELKSWLENFPGNTLGAVCEYCRDWLRKDVLPGYRDVDAQVVDLEAWFADRDVQSYIQRLDRKLARAQAFSFFNSVSPKEEIPSNQVQESKDEVNEFSSYDSSENIKNPLHILLLSSERWLREILSKPKSLPLDDELVGLDSPKRSVVNSKSKVLIGSIILLGFAASAASLNLFNFNPLSTFKKITQKQLTKNVSLSLDKETSAETLDLEKGPSLSIGIKFDPLIVNEPTKTQLRGLLDAWLASKSVVLAGGESKTLLDVARPNLVKRVEEERTKDALIKETQVIDATINSLKIVSRKPRRIELKAQLVYRDQRLDSSGEKISETYIPKLFVTYILGRDEQNWRLHEYISGN